MNCDAPWQLIFSCKKNAAAAQKISLPSACPPSLSDPKKPVGAGNREPHGARTHDTHEEKKEDRRHEGGVEPLALSCSTDLKSAPRTDEDHHGL